MLLEGFIIFPATYSLAGTLVRHHMNSEQTNGFRMQQGAIDRRTVHHSPP